MIYAAFTDLTDAKKSAIRRGVAGCEADCGPFGEVIRQIDEEGHIVWEWHFSNFGLAKNPLQFNANRWSCGHTNTVLPLPDGTILVSSKNLKMIFIVDPAIDELDWIYQNDEMGGQHDAQLLDNGNILVSANGAHSRDLRYSQV